jgi:hypothetical protein
MLDHNSPESEENLKNSLAFVEGFYSGIQIVSGYMDRYNESIRGVFSKPMTEKRDDTLKQLWARVYAWILTLERLNHTRFYQAIATGNRALLELTVDILFLIDDKTDEVAEKMLAFADSEKLKGAHNLTRYFEENKLDVPEEYKWQEWFIKTHEARVLALRAKYWIDKKGKQYHPKRWTGHDLSIDVEHVDQMFGQKIIDYFDISLTRYYRTEYRKLNWHIHAGMASTWKIPAESFDIACGFAFKWSADLAFLCTTLILSDFGFASVIDEMRREWEDLNLAKVEAFLNKVNE